MAINKQQRPVCATITLSYHGLIYIIIYNHYMNYDEYDYTNV